MHHSPKLPSGALRMCGAAILLSISANAFAAETASTSPPAPQPGPTGAVRWLELKLSPLPSLARVGKGEPAGDSVALAIMLIGDRVERAVLPPLGMSHVDVKQLKVENGKLSGQLVIGHGPGGNVSMLRGFKAAKLTDTLPLGIEVSLVGPELKGTFTGKWPRLNKAPLDVSGEMTGRLLDEAALAKLNAMPAEASWPSYLGPNQNFSCGPTSRPINPDFSQARLAWVSQYIGPTESGSKRYGACTGTPPAAGGFSPLVHRGLVYQMRCEPTGDLYQQHLDTRLAEDGEKVRAEMAAIGWTDADMRRRWSIDANEQLVCIDPTSGRTLWSIDWPNEGINYYDHKCALTNFTGVASEGKIYVLGGTGIVRCVDAESGKQVWSTPVPGLHDELASLKAKALEKRSLDVPTRRFAHALNISGGVVLAPDISGPGGLVGIEAATGIVLWRVPKVLSGCGVPLAWSSGGKHFAITATPDGVITAIDVKTGEVAWRVADAGENRWSAVLAGDRIIAHAMNAEEREKEVAKYEALPLEQWAPGAVLTAPGVDFGQVGCWELSTTGAKKLWTTPAEWGAPWFGPIGAVSGDLFCFRGKYAYQIVNLADGSRIAKSYLSAPARMDEGTVIGLPGLFVPHPDTQHGDNKFYAFPAAADAKVGTLWRPPHPTATAYQASLGHAWADGRLFIRGQDALYCYDLRQP